MLSTPSKTKAQASWLTLASSDHENYRQQTTLSPTPVLAATIDQRHATNFSRDSWVTSALLAFNARLSLSSQCLCPLPPSTSTSSTSHFSGFPYPKWHKHKPNRTKPNLSSRYHFSPFLICHSKSEQGTCILANQDTLTSMFIEHDTLLMTHSFHEIKSNTTNNVTEAKQTMHPTLTSDTPLQLENLHNAYTKFPPTQQNLHPP
jgi:hypothetical protein